MPSRPIANQTDPVPRGRPDYVKPQSVARLLGVTVDVQHGDERDSDETITELLQARLAAVWLADNGRQKPWSKLIRHVLHRNGSDGQQAIGTLLLDPRAPVSTIKWIRDRAKARAASEDSELEHAVATMIYFAAIAHALVYRRAKITTYSCESLESSFEKLVRKNWIPADFVELFRRAADLCRSERPRLGSK